MGNEFVTYRMADGSQIWGDYAFVTEPEFFEEVDEPVEVIKEVWVLKDSETITFAPTWYDEDEYEQWYNEADEDSIIGTKTKEQ